MENRKSCCLRMAPEVRKLCRHSTRCLRLTQLGALSLSACLDMRVTMSAPPWRSPLREEVLNSPSCPRRSMSYVDRLLLTLPSSAPQIADWFAGAAALTTSALPGWLPFGAIHLRLHSLCVRPQGCSAPAELHRLGGAAGVLVGSAHNLEHLANGSTSSEQLLRAHRRLGAHLPAALVGDFALVILEPPAEAGAPPRLQLSTDAFGSVPLWYAVDGQRFGASTCRAVPIAQCPMPNAQCPS